MKSFISVGGAYIAIPAILAIEVEPQSSVKLVARVLTAAGMYKTEGAEAEDLLLWVQVQTFDLESETRQILERDLPPPDADLIRRLADDLRDGWRANQ